MITYSNTRQDLTFAGKQHFVSKQSQENLKNILSKMNSEAFYANNGDVFVSSKISGLKINGKAFLKDNRVFVKPSNNLKGTTSLDFGRTHLKIDNQTGEIISHKKSFFTTWKSILKKADNYIQQALQNYDNKKVVNKRKITIEGLTKNGYQKLCNIMKTAK